MLFCARLTSALVAVLGLGLSEMSACDCCRGAQPVPVPGRVLLVGASVAGPSCCTLPAVASTLVPAQAGEKKEAGQDADTKDNEAKIRANLARLSPGDRKLAEAQRYCAVEDDHRLGAMGVPVKVLVKGQPVFLCCKGCKEDALAEPDKTLAKVKQLKAKAERRK